MDDLDKKFRKFHKSNEESWTTAKPHKLIFRVSTIFRLNNKIFINRCFYLNKIKFSRTLKTKEFTEVSFEEYFKITYSR